MVGVSAGAVPVDRSALALGTGGSRRAASWATDARHSSDFVACSALGAGYGAGGLASPAPAPAFAPVESTALAQQLDQAEEPIMLACSQAVRRDTALRPLLASLEMRDPRQLRLISVLRLFEQQQERLPPALMADTVLAYDDLPWTATFSVQAQLKRMADSLVSSAVAAA